MRFIRNRSPKDCCIVSIINACKYFGQKISYKDEEKNLKSILQYKPKKGCPTDLFVQFMRTIWMNSRYNIRTSMTGINLYPEFLLIDKDYIAMIIVHGHVFLLTEVRKKSYKVINYRKGKTISYLSKKQFTKLMKSDNIVLCIQKNKL